MKAFLSRAAFVFVVSSLLVSCRANENSQSLVVNSPTQPAATPTVRAGGGQSSVNENTSAAQGGAGEVTPAIKSELSTATRELLGIRLRGESTSAASRLADDYKNTKPDGTSEDKSQYLGNLKPFKDFAGFIFDEFEVESLRGDTAEVSGLVQAWDNSKKSLYSRFKWTFVKRDGKWLLQSSRDSEMKDSY